MLDRLDPALGAPDAVDAIYAAMDEPGDLVAALQALSCAIEASAARLDLFGQTDPLAQTPGYQEDRSTETLTREGPDGRRYRLSLMTPGAHADQERLFSHLLRAIYLAKRSARTEDQLSICSDALERLAVGAVFLDQSGAVTRCAGLAREVLDDRSGLVLRRDQVAACNDTDDRSLQSAIRTALSGTCTEPMTLAISRPMQERELGVIVRPLSDGAVILIRDADRGSAPQTAILRQFYGMTPTEAEVASNLSLGLTLDETAAAMSISRNTARAHLRAIFSKSGITRQTELVRLMLSSAAVLAMSPAA